MATSAAIKNSTRSPRRSGSIGPITILTCAAKPPINARIVQPMVSSKIAADLARIAAEIVHLAEDSCDDFDRENGQRYCEE
jgi:hypothetical protein